MDGHTQDYLGGDGKVAKMTAAVTDAAKDAGAAFLERATSATAETLDEARDLTGEISTLVKELVTQIAGDVRARSSRFGEGVAERVQERPLTAIALAGGFGYLLAHWTSRRSG